MARICARLLEQSNHIGKPNNGLIGVWPNGNTRAPGTWASARQKTWLRLWVGPW